MDLLIEAREVVKRNITLYNRFHFHVTLENGYIPNVRKTEILLPYPDGRLYTQNLTTAKFSTLSGFDELMEKIEPDKVLSVKIEGLDCKDLNKINDFIYCEDHFKGDIKEGFYYSYSLKHKKIVGAKRYYKIIKDWKGEICIFEKFITNVETPWLSLDPSIQLETIIGNCK